MKIDTSIRFIYVDLFCGAGGTSTGIENARIDGEKCAVVIACVNHDKNAIASHAENHPEALHFTEDIRTLSLDRLVSHIKLMQIKYPNAKLVLWASLECTNFSKAKGGQSRDADSRTLAEHLYRYIEMLSPDYIQIENVEEFMTWGPLIVKISFTEEGYEYCPCSRAKVKKDTYHISPVMIPDPEHIGEYYDIWVDHIKSYNYDFGSRVLNAADYGAYTSRKRYFAIFGKYSLPISFPMATHSKKGSTEIFSSFKKWNAVKHCLDFSDEGESIFKRKKPLVEATLDRVYAGLIKFVAGGKDKWLLKYNSVNGNTGKHNPPDIDNPCPTVSCQNRLGLIQTSFLCKHFSGHPDSKNISIDGPAHTITAVDHHSIVNTKFITKYFSGNPDYMISSIDDPAATLRTKDCQSIISTSFLSAYYGNGHNHSLNSPSPVVRTKDCLAYVKPKFLCSYNYKDEPKDLELPCPTVLTKDRFSLVSPQFYIDLQYGNGTPVSIDKPATTLTTNPKHQLVTCDKWLMNTNFNNIGSTVDNPAPVITANRKWHYLMQISELMKDIPPFIKINQNTAIYEIYDTDTPNMKAIKEFMVLYGILDIKMRMLRIPELKMIMGFPKNYILIGSQADQKKFIGNAVEVTMARVLCESLIKSILSVDKLEYVS